MTKRLPTDQKERESALDVRRSFIVQFGEEADLADGRVGGRVEHLRTGEARHFESLKALLAFVDEALTLDRHDAVAATHPCTHAVNDPGSGDSSNSGSDDSERRRA